MNLSSFSALGAVAAIVAAGAMLVPSASPAASPAAEDVQILTRGPVHEAFAETVGFEPQPGLIVRAKPPEPIEELPPEQQLEGDNVAWISGYWAWDDERNDFLWVSGVWRNLPPGRQWVPGYWSAIGEGQYQWTSGYWADSTTDEVTYIPTPPPRNIDAGPNIEAPSDDQCWIPGNWVWSTSRYIWRPGCWLPLRSNWTWVPSRYCWTRCGYVYVDGYWDYALACRGVLFAPVYFCRPIYTSADYCYTPGIVVGWNVFADHLFVRPRCGHYYFGDYYAPCYRDAGFYASCYWHTRYRGYDPIYAYDRWCHRHDRGWEDRRHEDYKFRCDHEDARPPHTWAAMRDSRDNRLSDGRNRMFARPLADVAKNPADGQRFRTLDHDRRQQLVAQNREMRKFGQERLQTEGRGIVTGTDSNNKAARVKLARSPMIGLQADRFAKNDAPPKRPEARGTNILVKPSTKDNLPLGITRSHGALNPAGLKKIPPELTADRVTDARDPQIRADRVTSIPRVKPENYQKNALRQSSGRKIGAAKEAPLRLTPQPNLQRKPEMVPQLKSQPLTQLREAPRRQTQFVPQLKSQPLPQLREAPQRQAQMIPQHQSQPQTPHIQPFRQAPAEGSRENNMGGRSRHSR